MPKSTYLHTFYNLSNMKKFLHAQKQINLNTKSDAIVNYKLIYLKVEHKILD